MKYAIVLLSLMGCMLLSSCSKEAGTVAPSPHTIKVVVSGTASYTVTLSAIKADETVSTALDTKTVASGGYTFTTGLAAGSQVHLEIMNGAGENTLSYSVSNSGVSGISDSDKELGSYSKITVDYTVN